MTPDIKAKLIEYLTSLESAVKSSGDFLLEQAPLVAQEYVAYQRGITTLYMLTLCVTACTVVRLCRVVLGELAKESCNVDVVASRSVIGVVILICGGFFYGINDVPDRFFKSWFAPRVLLIDYIRSEVAK